MSVIIPTYNRRDLLPQALDSVIAQTRQADEVIVIDDGSRDGTGDMLEERYRPQLLEEIASGKKALDGKGMHFAWAGGMEPGDGHYYRVQTAEYLFEYDNTQNGANHVHVAWRDFDGDFGADLLADHHAKHHTPPAAAK